MVASAIVHGEQLTDQLHTGDTNWFTALTVPAASWVASTEYLIWVSAHITGDSAATLFDIRLVHGAVPTLFTFSDMTYEPGSGITTNRHSYGHLLRWTQTSPAEDFLVQIRTQNAGQTVHADNIKVIAIPVSDLNENTDFYWNEDVTTIQHTTSRVDHAIVTLTPAVPGHDWLIIGSYSWFVDNTSITTFINIRRDGTEAAPSDDAPEFSEEGEDPDEHKTALLFRVFNIDNTEHTFALQGRDEAAANDHDRSAIAAIDLDAIFDSHASSWDESEFTPFGAADTYEEMSTLSYQPTVEGNQVMLAFAAQDGANGANLDTGIRMQVDNVQAPTGGDAYFIAEVYDLQDEPPMIQSDYLNMTAAAHDLDFDGKADDTTLGIKYRAFVVFSAELADASEAPVPPSLPEYGQVRTAIGDPAVYGATIFRS